MPDKTWTDYLPLRRSDEAPAPPPNSDGVRYYSDSDGGLRSLLADGTDDAVGGGGGGSQTDNPLQIIDIAFDTPNVEIQGFPIIAVDTGAKTFTIAGDHADLFPETAACTVNGSTGNDNGVGGRPNYYTVAAVAVAGGDTVVTINETVEDGTADGELCNDGTVGVVLAPAGSVVLTGGVLLIEPFDNTLSASQVNLICHAQQIEKSIGGSDNPPLVDIVLADGVAAWQTDSVPTGLQLFQGDGVVIDAPLIAVLCNLSYNRSLSTQGKLRLLLGVLPPPA